MARRHPFRAITLSRGNNWVIGTVSGILAIAALVAASQGTIHGKAHQRLLAWIGAGGVLLFGALATTRLATALGRTAAMRSLPAAGGAVRILAAAVGYLFVLFAVLGVLRVSITHLLVGAGLAGVVLGIAAQQSLGNMFAGMVLLMAHPFSIGDHVRIRSGALGGIFDAWVHEISLTYVTLRTEDGDLKVPNSAMLAAGVLRLPTVTSRSETVADAASTRTTGGPNGSTCAR